MANRIALSQTLRKTAAALLWVGLTATSPVLAQNPADQTGQIDPQAPATISGKVVDQSGSPIAGAHVTFRQAAQSDATNTETITNDDGLFSFSGIPTGSFQLEIAQQGFDTQTTSGILHSGESFRVPQMTLSVAGARTEIVVTPNQFQIAEEQIKEQEKQRVLGVIPNFYVTYVRDAAPLSPKQKFQLAWKSTIDPVNFAITGVVAGVQQSQNDFSGYGQGAQGYARRYGAEYGNTVASTFIGGAVLPSLLKQDPRYFYKGTGTARSRVLYALANSVICKGDNGHWQPNYSSILGSLAAGGIANLYYPAEDRNDFGLTVETALIGIGATAATNLLQEFVIRRFTPSASNPNSDPAAKTPKVQNLISKFLPKSPQQGD
jgi:protocatechuate 3,4-dioxygenase beta subunit